MSEQMTTAEMIEKRLNDIHDTYPGSVYDCFRVIAKEIAADIDAKDKRIAELEQLATLTPIKVGDISITLGLTETGEARMTFDGADDATLAVVAGKFAAAMQVVMESAKAVPNA